MLFCRITGRGVASTRLRRDFGGWLAGVPVPRIPPRRRPFRARKDPINAYPKHRKRDLTRSGPEALRILHVEGQAEGKVADPRRSGRRPEPVR